MSREEESSWSPTGRTASLGNKLQELSSCRVENNQQMLLFESGCVVCQTAQGGDYCYYCWLLRPRWMKTLSWYTVVLSDFLLKEFCFQFFNVSGIIGIQKLETWPLRVPIKLHDSGGLIWSPPPLKIPLLKGQEVSPWRWTSSGCPRSSLPPPSVGSGEPFRQRWAAPPPPAAGQAVGCHTCRLGVAQSLRYDTMPFLATLVQMADPGWYLKLVWF